MRDRPLGRAATAAAVFALGFVVSLAGDACHVYFGAGAVASGLWVAIAGGR